MSDGIKMDFHVEIELALKRLQAQRIADQIRLDQFIASFGARQRISPTQQLIEPTRNFLHPIPIQDSSQQHRFNNLNENRFMAAESSVHRISDLIKSQEALVAQSEAKFDEVTIDTDDNDEYDNKGTNSPVMANTSANAEVLVHDSRLSDSFDIDFESAFTNEMIEVDGESYFEDNMYTGINLIVEKREENGFNTEEHVNGCNVFDKMPEPVVNSFPSLFDDTTNEHNMLDKMPQKDLVFGPSLIVGLSTTYVPAKPIKGVSSQIVFKAANCMGIQSSCLDFCFSLHSEKGSVLCELHDDWLTMHANFFTLFHRHLEAPITPTFMDIQITLIGVSQFNVFDRGK